MDIEKLHKLDELRKSGTITDEEFQKEKAKLTDADQKAPKPLPKQGTGGKIVWHIISLIFLIGGLLLMNAVPMNGGLIFFIGIIMAACTTPLLFGLFSRVPVIRSTGMRFLFGFIFSIIILISMSNKMSQEKELQDQVLSSMRSKYSGTGISVKSINLIKESSNKYVGYADISGHPTSTQLTIDVTLDGDKMLWKAR